MLVFRLCLGEKNSPQRKHAFSNTVFPCATFSNKFFRPFFSSVARIFFFVSSEWYSPDATLFAFAVLAEQALLQNFAFCKMTLSYGNATPHPAHSFGFFSYAEILSNRDCRIASLPFLKADRQFLM